MERLIEVTGGPGGYGWLIRGEQCAALWDGGMACAGAQLTENCRVALGPLPLGYNLISHGHYDHVGTLPGVRLAFPEVVSVGAHSTAEALPKASKQMLMRSLTEASARDLGLADFKPDWEPKAMRIDLAAREGDTIALGGLTVRVVETPGHTRECLSFYIEELETLLMSETLGMLVGGVVFPCYLTDYIETLNSIERCRTLGAKRLLCSHFGGVPEAITPGYWDEARRVTAENHDFILELLSRGLPMARMLSEYSARYYTPEVAAIQPHAAFYINAEACLSAVGSHRTASSAALSDTGASALS